MKIRSDFVTNSSSSSFISIHVNCDIIDDFLKSKNKTFHWAECNFESDLESEDLPISSSAASKKPSDVLIGFYYWLLEFYDAFYPCYDEDEDDEDYSCDDEDDDILSPGEIEELIEFISKNSDEIDSSLYMKIEAKSEMSEGDEYFCTKKYSVDNGHGLYKELERNDDELISSKGNIKMKDLKNGESDSYCDIRFDSSSKENPERKINFYKKYGEYIEF